MFRKFLTWLSSFFPKAKESQPSDRFDVYKPEERLIFTYWDGQKDVRADPNVLWRAVMDEYHNIEIDEKVARSPSKNARKAWLSMVEKMRKVFSIKSLAEGGLTEGETVDLYNKFQVFVHVIKKNSSTPTTPATAPSQNSPPSTADTSSASASEPPPTRNPGDSGSTVKEDSTNMPTQSPSEPVSPLV